MRDTYNALRRALPALGIASALFAQRAVAHEPEPIEFSEIGIPYAWLVEIDDGEATHIEADHVGAWSWDEDSFPATAKGWTHTSKWIKVDLTEPAALTLTLERQSGVPWPSPAEPDRVAGTNLFPSFTLYRGWDTDAGLIVLTNGATVDQDHTFNNRGNIEWAEDVQYLDHLDNSTAHSATRTWVLPAGHYTINLGGNSPVTLAEGRQGLKATFSTAPAPVALTNAELHDIAFNEVGIPYGIGLAMDANASATTLPDHVGAWSWDEDNFPATAKGWTHTSKWVKLRLLEPAKFTLLLESREEVAWPSSADPSRLAGTNLFPSFTIYRGWDMDAGITFDTNGVSIDQDHTFNNRGNIEWAEDVTYLNHLDNSTTHSATRTWVLAAGDYSINLGGNSPATLAEGRQGYRASFTTEPLTTDISDAALFDIEFSEVGIPYGVAVTLGDNSIVQTLPDHVGAWSWDEDNFPATAKGWTHTSKWVKLDLTEPAALTLTLESLAGVPWPSSSDPDRVAGTNLYPSFTLYRGWDTDAGITFDTNGVSIDQDHTFNNRGNVAWAEDVQYLDHLENSTEHSATRTWVLPAGHYTINLGGNSPATLAEGRQGYLATLSTSPATVAVTNAELHDIAFNEVGIPYGIGLAMDDNSSATTTPDHVGAWSWDEDGFPATAKGWTHTSKWVKLNLTKAARFTLVLESRDGVPWPSSSDPDRLAGTNLFPSFSIYRGWDTDAGVGTVDQDHTFNNRGNIEWAEDVTYLDHLDNSAAHTATRSWMLPAGQYTINLGGNSPVTLAEGRQGYRATFTTAPLVVLPDTQASGIAYLTYNRAAWAKIAPSAAYTDISGNPTGATNSTADVDGRRWMFPDRIEGKDWAAARYPADYLTGLPAFPLPQPARGFALPVNSYGTNSFTARHKITSFNSSTNPAGYVGLAGSLRITSDFNEPGASVWWEHLAIRQDPADSVWKIFATSGAGQGSVFELVNVAMETVNGSLHLSADYVFGNTEWLQFFQGANGDLDTNAILGHIELVPSESTTLIAGQATINYDQAAWDTLASGFAAPPVLTLSAFYNQAEANALEQSQLITNAQSGASYTGQVYAMNDANVTNLPTRYTQPTTFSYTPGNVAGHTGQIGLGGVARFAVLGGVGGNLLFGDLTLQYDINRVALGGSGWYLFGNIPPAAAVFDLLNVTISETPSALTISGDMGVSFEVANLLFATPGDTLKDVGDFNFTGYKVPFTTPSIARVIRSGANVVVHGANGVPGSTFALVSSADVSAPLSSWSTVATGTFDVAGGCSITLPINSSEPARFFRLRQP